MAVHRAVNGAVNGAQHGASGHRSLLPARGRLLRALLFGVLAGDLAISAALRGDRVRAFLHGDRDWQGWLGVFGLLYLLLVGYVLARVLAHFSWIGGELARRETALAAHADTSSEWLWEATPELTLTYSSRRVAEFLGYAPADLVGRDAHDFMTPETAARSRAAVDSGALVNGWRDMETDWEDAAGRVVRLRHSAAPLLDRHGRLLGYRGSSGPATRERRDTLRLADQRTRIESALAGSGLSMAFQPIFEARGHALAGVEALARFADGRPPPIWFDEAAEVGLRVELELLAVRRGLAVLADLPPGVAVSVNASPEVVLAPEFAQTLTASGAPLSGVVLEVTEHVRILQYDAVQAALDPLRQRGLRLAVDDAGAGYASLAHVLRLRPDIIKLDRSLVAGVAADRARRTLIVAFTLLGNDIGATITAEGVETAEELEALTDLGVDHVQGYLLGSPAPMSAAWLAAFAPGPEAVVPSSP